jgi:hypothetical protein
MSHSRRDSLKYTGTAGLIVASSDLVRAEGAREDAWEEEDEGA